MNDNSIDALVMFHRQRIASLLKRQEQRRRAQHFLSSVSMSANTTTISPLSASEAFFTIPELVLTVLKFLYMEDLPQACLVCRLWSALAQPLLWRHDIRLESDSQIQAFAASVTTCGAWVQSLDFRTRSNEEEFPFSHIDLTNILPHTPQLRWIDVRDRTMDKHPLMVLAPCSQLESIAFTQCEDHFLDLGPDGNRDIFSVWPQLKHLSISGTDWERQSAAAALLEKALVDTKSLHLETINLDTFPTWSPLTVHHLVRTNADYLRYLDLVNCRFILHDFFEETLVAATQLESFGLHKCLHATRRLLQFAQTHPRLKRLSLTDWVHFPTDVMTQVARACPLLESLELDNCGDTVIAARQFLAHCPHLRTLILFPLDGPNVMDLFLGEPWVCKGIEKFRIKRIDYQPSAFTSTEARDGAIKAMWRQLAAQTHMRSLLLQFTLPKYGAMVLHPDGDSARKSQHKKVRNLHDDGLYQLEALKRLKELGVIRYCVWEFADVEWMARSFPCMKRFWYHRDEVSVPQSSWLRFHRPEIWLGPSEVLSSSQRTCRT